MTVANQTSRTSAVGSGAAGQVIPFSFPINDSSDLKVKTRVTATGIEATLDENTDYTVTINGDKGGSVTLIDALAGTSQVFVIRDTPNTQNLDLEQGGAFNAENVEDCLDKNCRLGIENKDQIDRSIHAPDTDSTSLDMELPNSIDRKSQYLAFDANGKPTVVASVAPPTATITAFMELVLATASAAAARAILGLVIGTDVQAYSALLTAIAALAATDGNFIVGNGTTFVAESGATARTSMGAAAESEVVKITEVVGYDNEVVMYDDEIVIYPA